ncbi:3-ketoacyl-CoA synthase 19 [Linum perenne]
MSYRSNQSCYLLAYKCYKGPDELKLSTGAAAGIALRNKNLGLEEYKFLVNTMARSGIGEETYIPRNIYEGREASCTLHDCLQELTEVTFTTLDELFATSGVSPSQIDIIITTGSLFAPVPSLTSRIVNKYNMKEGIKSYSLTGMGCSSRYMEAKKRLKKGDKVLMVGLGAGFLCNTCVWTVTMDLGDGNVWGDCVHRYPLNTMVNPIREKMDWLFDECMSFIRFEDYDRSHILKIMIT